MSLSEHVRTLGRGPGRSRSLTRDEAEDAMEIMLSGDAAPEAVGALLMLLRMKGETSDEIAGLAAGAAAHLPSLPPVDLDWPSYAAGRSRGLPWFLLSAKLVALSGHRVLMHGWNGADPKVRAGLSEAGIPRITTPGSQAIAYMALEDLAPNLFSLLNLRDVLGLRSCINTVARMLNPAQAPTSVQGVFHPSYRMKQSEAAQTLGLNSLTVIKGGGGEFERNPGKTIAQFGLRNGALFEAPAAPVTSEAMRLSDGPAPATTLAGLWSGAQHDPFALAVVLGTADLALETLGDTRSAQSLWDSRFDLQGQAA